MKALITITSISPSPGLKEEFFEKDITIIDYYLYQFKGLFAARSQNAGHEPLPLGNLALYSMIPYLNFRVEIRRDDVYCLPLLFSFFDVIIS